MFFSLSDNAFMREKVFEGGKWGVFGTQLWNSELSKTLGYLYGSQKGEGEERG